MALILAIESDKRQVNYLTAMVRGKLHAELVLGDTAEGALDRLGDRVPDLILTSALLSPKDEQALTDRLRRLNGVAAHVQTLTLPILAPPTPRHPASSRGGVLSALLGDRDQSSAPDGCDPAVFADQCKEYLRRAADDREARRHDEPVEEPAADATLEAECDEEPPATVDIDLSEMLAEEPVASGPVEAATEDEPAVYELSAESIDLDLVAAPAEEAAPPAPEAPGSDFDDWQKVIDALKRESAQVRVPRERPAPTPVVQTTAAPAPPAAGAKLAADAPKRRLRVTRDEWNTFDPTQVGMAALYERLEQITREKV